MLKEEFLDRAEFKFGRRFDYSRIPNEFHINTTKVEILCPDHGVFIRTPKQHLNIGCPQCRTENRITIRFNKWVSQATQKYNGKFQYQLSSIPGKIEVTCPQHGVFICSKRDHIHGSYGCINCYLDSVRYSIQDVFDTISEVHGDRYSYGEISDVINSDTEIDIFCPRHGQFSQNLFWHLWGQGCKWCAVENNPQLKPKYTVDDFLKIAYNEFGERFLYYPKEFTLWTNNIRICCKIHGDFIAKPYSHVNSKHGSCPDCHSISSTGELKWLDSLGLPNDPEHRQVILYRNGQKYIKVDGFDPDKKTVYEYLGDYWHGNPNIYNHTDIHSILKITFGELYQYTFKRIGILENLGYKVIHIWESDFLNSG